MSTAGKPRALAICADDYGLSPGIDRACLDLARRGRISAISCMTSMPGWRNAACALMAPLPEVDLGLHLTLVDERPLTGRSNLAPDSQLPTIGELIAKSLLGRLPLDDIRREINAQLDAFEDVLGRIPDHIDGHLHAHTLPGIRDVVRDLIARRAPQAWVRDVSEPWFRIRRRGVAVIKSTLIAALGTRSAWGVRRNDGFGGIRTFDPTEDTAAIFEDTLADTGPRPLVVVHPCDSGDDPVAHAAARAGEYAFLAGDTFPAMMARRGFKVTRLSTLL